MSDEERIAEEMLAWFRENPTRCISWEEMEGKFATKEDKKLPAWRRHELLWQKVVWSLAERGEIAYRWDASMERFGWKRSDEEERRMVSDAWELHRLLARFGIEARIIRNSSKRIPEGIELKEESMRALLHLMKERMR